MHESHKYKQILTGSYCLRLKLKGPPLWSWKKIICQNRPGLLAYTLYQLNIIVITIQMPMLHYSLWNDHLPEIVLEKHLQQKLNKIWMDLLNGIISRLPTETYRSSLLTGTLHQTHTTVKLKQMSMLHNSS